MDRYNPKGQGMELRVKSYDKRVQEVERVFGGQGMKPYFETELGKLYNCDCLEFMQTMEDKSVDLCLCDPPYGINIAVKGFGGTKKIPHTEFSNVKSWDIKPDKETFSQILRSSKNQIIWGGNYFTDYLYPSPCWLLWDKRCGVIPERTYADGEMAWTSFKQPTRIFRYIWDGMLQGNMKHKEERRHPTQKPSPLIMWCLKRFDGDVFDPFLGSGTTAVACEKLGRKWIGIEISEKYCEIAARRISAEASQIKLFQEVYEKI